MCEGIRLLDVVALIEDMPQKGLRRGQVGTVVELLPPDAYLVEFSDSSGRAYAMLSAKAEQLVVLHYKPKAARRDHSLRR